MLTSSDWQQQLREVVTDPAELLSLLQLPVSILDDIMAAGQTFKLRIPRSFIQRIKPGNFKDPLLLQVLPQVDELISMPGYSPDPLQEQAASPVPGLLHKYFGRVLLTMAGSCAVNCRYCFRRSFPYQAHIPDQAAWQKILNYIANDSTIHEVIFSGGEPLLLKDELLARRIKDLEKIEHLKNLRIHTRLPIVIPARVTNELMQALTSRLNLIVVLHANHAQEFDAQVSLACQLLSRHTMALLNQTVLLKGVNDSSQVLVDLSHALFEHAVMPYYLHLLDAVKGAAHFNVTKTRALAIYQEVTHKLPGYLVPKLVQELPNQAAKQSVSL